MSVNCSNGVSADVATVTAEVQETITGLRLVKSGADKNTDFYIEIEVDSGSNVTLTVTFDGVTLPGTLELTHFFHLAFID